MRRFLTSLFALTGTALFISAAHAGDGSVRHPSGKHLQNSYIVVLRDDVDSIAVGEQLGLKHAVKVTGTTKTLLKTFVMTATEAQAQAISTDPRVRYVEDNGLASVTTDQSPVPSWALDRIDQISLPVDNHYLYNYSGLGVTVYVVDTGVNPVADISGRLVRQRNFVNRNGVDPNDYGDCYGHGTQVADILGGTTYGVAKNVTFVNVKVFDCFGGGVDSDFVSALDWIVSDYMSHSGPAVINFSGRFFGIYQNVDEAVMRVLNAGITFVCGAGNEGVDACQDSPGHLSNPNNFSPNPNQYSVLNVSGTTPSDGFNSFLNYGPCVSILAPSQNIPAYDHNNNLTIFGATSGATPFVAGVAALHLERFPTATPSVIGAYIKSNGTANKITDVPAGTPNLFIYNSIYDRRHACCVY